MLNKKGFAQTALLVAILGSLIVGFFAGGALKGGGGFTSGSASSNLMYLTNPVFSFSGKVTKVGFSDFSVSQTFYSSQMGPGAGAPPLAGQNGTAAVTPQPTPVPKVLTFKVLIGKNTTFNQGVAFVPYLLKNNNGNPQQLQQPVKVSLKDVKEGQTVTVSTLKDLRTLSSNEFEATQVQLPTPVNTISGQISQINSGTLSVKGYLPNYGAGPGVAVAQQAAAPKVETFNFQVTSDTEISGNLPPESVKPGEQPKPPVAKKYSLDELKVGQQVTVYADGEVTSGKAVTALRIEPAIQIQAAPAPEAVVPSAAPLANPTLVPTVAVKPTVTSEVVPTTSKVISPTVSVQ